jgi:hypothetical protein
MGGQKKENLMKNIPYSDYIIIAADYRLFALSWFMKMYPELPKIKEYDFEPVSFNIFDVCKNLIGTESGSALGPGFGGSHAEIRCATAAAMGIAIEFDDDEVRHFNNSTIVALTEAWQSNDHASFLAHCSGIERNATNSKIDLLPLVQEISESVWEMR